MKFIDLFAGLGGFHLALENLNHECVFASELNQGLRDLYQKNFDMPAHGDIKKIVTGDIKKAIPKHDILCGGFPCQPFSKAGNQAGMTDENRGTLFDDIISILEARNPRYFILENVPFIAKHDNEQTWAYMLKKLSKLEYIVDHQVYSPHEFGIPQHRNRIFIVGSKIGLKHFSWPVPEFKGKTDVHQFIEQNPAKPKLVHKDELECLALWQEFLDTIPAEDKIPGCPIWAMEFGATYPYDKKYPGRMNEKELGKYAGNFGVSLKGLTKKEQYALMPNYAATKKKFPSWKKSYIKQNREFYEKHKEKLAPFIKKLSRYESQSWQKLEWNVQDGERDIYKYIIQFRASGIRVKKTDFFPSLVCTNTQIPIIGWQKRYITRKEGARLQSLHDLPHLPENDTACFKALGNAVNAKIVGLIAERLIKKPKPKKQIAKVKVKKKSEAALELAH